MVQQDFTKIILRIVFFVKSNRTKVIQRYGQVQFTTVLVNSIYICETREIFLFSFFFSIKLFPLLIII